MFLMLKLLHLRRFVGSNRLNKYLLYANEALKLFVNDRLKLTIVCCLAYKKILLSAADVINN